MPNPADVVLALRGGKPDCLPYFGDGSWCMGDYEGRKPPKNGRDAWGVEWTPLPEGYVAGAGEPAESFATGHPCTTAAEVCALTLPKAPEIGVLEHAGVAVIGQHPAGPLDRFMSLLGHERGYLSLARDPSAAAAALLHIAGHHVAIAQRWLAAGVQAVLLPDDYAGQGGPFISPTLWRRIVFPAVARILDVYRRADTPVIFHTCGEASAFIGDLLEAGASAFNLETRACDLPALRRRFGRRIAFYGGVPAAVLLNERPSDIRAAVREVSETLGKDGGLVLAPDQPLAFSDEAVAAFVAEARKCAT